MGDFVDPELDPNFNSSLYNEIKQFEPSLIAQLVKQGSSLSNGQEENSG